MRCACRWSAIPAEFDAIVTNNMFGDIITDLAAGLQGGLGMAASGNYSSRENVDVRAGTRLSSQPIAGHST